MPIVAQIYKLIVTKRMRCVHRNGYPQSLRTTNEILYLPILDVLQEAKLLKFSCFKEQKHSTSKYHDTFLEKNWIFLICNTKKDRKLFYKKQEDTGVRMLTVE